MTTTASQYTPREELANALTHGIGLLLSIAGLVLMVTYSALRSDAWAVTSTAIFGATLVLLYTTSTLYHSFRREDLKRMMRKFDHAAIFLLIAGTYTPFLLISLRGPWGWSLFGVVWGLAAVGVALKFWFTGRFRLLSTLIYIGMGWLVIIAFRPLIHSLPAGGLWLLFAGGLCYTGGAVFYLMKRVPYHHAVWHLWVLAGSACHWAAVFGYLTGSA
ncbi:MAG TPA: hemolysin III family protein [Opitutaceae bacterium]|nr:hemolysin III family protein [Opitutaceae bacterium]HND59918.1 hemolysin III family protein [Opitutaceae bacterium]